MGPCGWVHTTAVQKGPVPRATIGEVVSVIQVTQRSWLRRALTTHIGIVVITCYYWTKPLRIYNKFNIQSICNDTIKRLVLPKQTCQFLFPLRIWCSCLSCSLPFRMVHELRSHEPSCRTHEWVTPVTVHLPLLDTDSRTLLKKDMLMAILRASFLILQVVCRKTRRFQVPPRQRIKGWGPWDLLGQITSLLDWVIRESIGSNSKLKTLAGSA